MITVQKVNTYPGAKLTKRARVVLLDTDDLETVSSVAVDEILSINLEGSHSGRGASQSTKGREDAAIRLRYNAGLVDFKSSHDNHYPTRERSSLVESQALQESNTYGNHLDDRGPNERSLLNTARFSFAFLSRFFLKNE